MDQKWQQQVLLIAPNKIPAVRKFEGSNEEIGSGIKKFETLTHLCMMKGPALLIPSISFLHWKDSFEEYFSGPVKQTDK